MMANAKRATFCSPGAVLVLAVAAAGGETTLEAKMKSGTGISAVEFADITLERGMLLARARATFDLYKGYSPKHVLSLNYSTTPSDHAFPGDTIGRYILSTTLLCQALHEEEPETLKHVMAAIPGMLNEEGYLGWVLPKDRADETGLANLGWANGLTEYYLWKRDRRALEMNRNLFARVVLPVKEAYYYYYSPEKNDGKIKWVHCTGDTAQGFAIIDVCSRGYALFPSAELKQETDELIRLYARLDRVKIKAQIHATLYLTRGMLRWYETQGDPKHLELAKAIYDQYRSLAMTENYENYNWFGRPEWTEGCAIVDSLTVVQRLFRMTGDPRYLADMQLILYNALLANQKGGDFGTNTCVGPNRQLFLKDGPAPIAPWCCSVWGGKGLARTIQSTYFLAGPALVVANFVNSTVTARLAGGELRLRQTSNYPYEGDVTFEILSAPGATAAKEPELRVFIPPWVLADSIELTVAGTSAKAEVRDSFLPIRRAFAAGDIVRLRFRQKAGPADLLDPKRTPGYHRYMHGPLVLGADSREEKTLPLAEPLEPLGNGSYKAGGVTLVPLCDLANRRDDARRAKSGAIQVLFKD